MLGNLAMLTVGGWVVNQIAHVLSIQQQSLLGKEHLSLVKIGPDNLATFRSFKEQQLS